MKNCREVEKELSAYLDGELGEAVRAEVQRHLGSCERCRRHLAELERLSAGVAGLPRLEPPPGFVAEVRRKIRGAQPERSWLDWVFRPVWLKLPLEAVAVLVVAVGVMFLAQQQYRQERPKVCVVTPESLTAPAGASDGLRSEPSRALDGAPAGAPAPVPSAPVARAAAPEPLRAALPSRAEDRVGLGRRKLASQQAAEVEGQIVKSQVAEKSAEVEAVSVRAADAALMQKRVIELVQTLGGSVLEVKREGQLPGRLRVRLPTAKTAMLKARLGEMETDSAQQLGAAGAALGLERESERNAKCLKGEAAPPRDEPMSELEIQIVAPAP